MPTSSTNGADGRQPDPLSKKLPTADSLPHPSQRMPQHNSGAIVSPLQWHRPQRSLQEQCVAYQQH